MRFFKKLISVLLVLILMTAGIASAFADEQTGISAYATGTGSDVSKETDEVVLSADNATGVSSVAEEEGKASVTVSNSVTVTGTTQAEGVYAGATGGGQAEIKVGGSVTAEGNSATGIVTKDDVKGQSSVTVDQSVTADGTEDATGISAMLQMEGKSFVTVHGSVEAEGNSASAIYVYGQNSETEIMVDGEVRVDGQSGKVCGINVLAEDNSSVKISAGSVHAGGKSDPDNTEAVHIVTRDTYTEVKLRASGDVVSSGDGIFVDDELGGDVDIIIEGTLSAKGISAVTFGDFDHVSLAAWKIEGEDIEASVPGADGSSAEQYASGYAPSYAYYIIQSEQPKAGGSFELNGTQKKEDLDVARFDETVSLSVNLDKGYKLNGAYTGKGERVKLEKDENGNYYLKVPMGGGVYLTVDISRIQDRKTGKTQTKGDPLAQFCKTLAQRIREAPQGGTVEADATAWKGLRREVFKALSERPDVTLKLTCRLNGETTELTVPAGTDLLSAMGDTRTLTFEQIAQLLG